jgi:hypothetical protein
MTKEIEIANAGKPIYLEINIHWWPFYYNKSPADKHIKVKSVRPLRKIFLHKAV